ncbi:hypothetical protein ACU5AX_15720 [Sphingomonas sp. XXL09]|uniref:hypothetical protein n=1 Tax=Sphingomonas sp. XXL09 TaxID=3457787 RepID=UPI00406BBACF
MARRLRSDALIALALALLLGVVWTIRAWGDLAQLRLPDTDDVMRLAQVRDWLAGQAWDDLHQYRLAGGLAMHWTRLADLGPAALIVVLRPVLGLHGAEVAAVAAWPILLFAAALCLVIRIARRLGGGAIAATAGVVAALAYPATTIFVPGRIDHHGLQMVLLLGAVLGLLDGRARGAAAAGLCAGAGLVVGLETAPLIALLGLWLLIRWTNAAVQEAAGRCPTSGGGDRMRSSPHALSHRRFVLAGEEGGDGPSRRQLCQDSSELPGMTGACQQADDAIGAFAVGALVALLVGRAVFAGDGFDYAACDGFTRVAWQAALTMLAAPILLAGLGPSLTSTRARASAAVAIGTVMAAAALWRSPSCLNPYGAVDPRLARLWLTQVGEAQSIATAPLATTLGYAGVALAGLVATLWQWRRSRSAGWGLIAGLLAMALAVTAVQLRGAYPAALLAAPALAAVVATARTRGSLALVASWLASAGLLYPLAAEALTRPPVPAGAPAGQGDCASPATIATLARLPAGTVIAPVDAGAWIVGGTAHRVLAAPYHRDGRGMLATYAFYAAPASQAAVRADWLGARYLLACAGLPGADRPGTVAAALGHGAAAGFVPVAQSPDGAVILVRKRLSEGAPPA